VTESALLEDRIAALAVEPGTAACVWLGQGGYLFKSPGGVTLMVDPYLSDFAEPAWGVRRAIPPVIDVARFAPDVLLITHWHEDHLDMPTVRHYAQQPEIAFGGPESCTVRAQIWGWPAERTVILEQGDSDQFGDVAVTATFARHDEAAALTPDAVGFLLDIGPARHRRATSLERRRQRVRRPPAPDGERRHRRDVRADQRWRRQHERARGGAADLAGGAAHRHPDALRHVAGRAVWRGRDPRPRDVPRNAFSPRQ
jgi:hypothetical protein